MKHDSGAQFEIARGLAYFAGSFAILILFALAVLSLISIGISTIA